MAIGFSYLDGLDISVMDWASQMSVKPSGQYLFNLSTFVKGLKSEGIWTNLDYLWIFATEQQEHAQIDLVRKHSLIEVNSPNWSTNGYLGNGSNMYLNLDFAMNTITAGTRNNRFYGYYKRTNASSSAFDVGWNNASSQGDVFRPNTSGVKAVGCNSVQGTNTASVGNNGLFVAQRTAGASYDIYRNGINVETRTNASIVLPALKFYVMCRNNNGVANAFSNQQFSMVYFGAVINQTVFYDLFQEFAIKQGFNV